LPRQATPRDANRTSVHLCRFPTRLRPMTRLLLLSLVPTLLVGFREAGDQGVPSLGRTGTRRPYAPYETGSAASTPWLAQVGDSALLLSWTERLPDSSARVRFTTWSFNSWEQPRVARVGDSAARAVESSAQAPRRDTNTWAITNVNVVTMRAPGDVLRNATVVIDGNRIVSVNGPVPRGVTAIDGKGQWLVPGLMDMHVHLTADAYLGARRPTQLPDVQIRTQDVMTPYIANGVTTVADLNSMPETVAQKKQIEHGDVIGPRVVLSYLINGSGRGRVAKTPEEGRLLVRTAKVEGYDLVKVYSHLDAATYHAILQEAAAQGIRTVGHIPAVFEEQPLEPAALQGLGMVAHAEEFSKHSKLFSDDDARTFAALAKKSGSALTPTLTTMVWIASQTRSLDGISRAPGLQYVHPLLQSRWLTANNYNRDATAEDAQHFERMAEFHLRLVKAFAAAGVPIVAGTDVGVSGVIPGFSLHDELALLVQAGLSPYDALAAATRTPAAWLGVDAELGTVEAGKLADLVLLERNPLDDIANTRAIAAVVVNGRRLVAPRLRQMLDDLARRNTADKPRYDWRRFMEGAAKAGGSRQ
jgi:imidazolonepropionase-like amidohydrolase